MVASILVEENTSGGSEKFPHLDGEIPREAVLGVYRLVRDEDSRFCLEDLASKKIV